MNSTAQPASINIKPLGMFLIGVTLFMLLRWLLLWLSLGK